MSPIRSKLFWAHRWCRFSKLLPEQRMF